MEATTSAEDRVAALRRALEKDGQLPPELQDLSGESFVEADLSGLDLTGCNFSGCDMTGCNLTKARCPSANFDGATLHKAMLDGAEFLGSTFVGTNLSECSAKGTGFGMTDQTDASFFNARLEEAKFVDAQLRRTNFANAKAANVRMLEASLESADFSNADLSGAELSETDLAGARFRYAKLLGAQLREVNNYTKADWIGADIRDIDFTGAYLVRNFIIDENYLYEFRNQSSVTRAVYFVWKTTSDCGRSMVRWGGFLALNVLLFAIIYWAMGPTHLDNMPDKHGFIHYLYFSVVTFTTLGYGDITPITAAGRAVLIIHIAIGYLGLGALLSILATKFASRGH